MVKNIAYVVYNYLGVFFFGFTPIKSTWIGVQESESTNLSENEYCKISWKANSSEITPKIYYNIVTMHINLRKKYRGDMIRNAAVG